MLGENVGLEGLSENDPRTPEFLPHHQFVHHEPLVTK